MSADFARDLWNVAGGTARAELASTGGTDLELAWTVSVRRTAHEAVTGRKRACADEAGEVIRTGAPCAAVRCGLGEAAAKVTTDLPGRIDCEPADTGEPTATLDAHPLFVALGVRCRLPFTTGIAEQRRGSTFHSRAVVVVWRAARRGQECGGNNARAPQNTRGRSTSTDSSRSARPHWRLLPRRANHAWGRLSKQERGGTNSAVSLLPFVARCPVLRRRGARVKARVGFVQARGPSRKALIVAVRTAVQRRSAG